MMSRWLPIGVAWLLLVVATLGYRWLGEQVEAGAGYLARELCSCVHVGERTFAHCRADMPARMSVLDAEPLPAGDGVRAHLSGFGERVARFRDDGGGCTLH